MFKLNQKGFSLVEIIVASILLAVVSAGIFSISISAKKIVSSSTQRLYATDVAQAVLDNMRAYLGADQWTGAAGSPFATSGWQPGSGYYTFANGQPAFIDSVADIFRGTDFDTLYNGRWRYRVINPGGGYDYRKVEVEVVWDEVSI